MKSSVDTAVIFSRYRREPAVRYIPADGRTYADECRRKGRGKAHSRSEGSGKKGQEDARQDGIRIYAQLAGMGPECCAHFLKRKSRQGKNTNVWA